MIDTIVTELVLLDDADNNGTDRQFGGSFEHCNTFCNKAQAVWRGKRKGTYLRKDQQKGFWTDSVE